MKKVQNEKMQRATVKYGKITQEQCTIVNKRKTGRSDGLLYSGAQISCLQLYNIS